MKPMVQWVDMDVRSASDLPLKGVRRLDPRLWEGAHMDPRSIASLEALASRVEFWGFRCQF